MDDSAPQRILRPHLRRETLKVALSGYLGAGLRRAVLGVTDRRMLLVRSNYWTLSDKGLLWADPIDEVALGSNPIELHMSGVYTGNTYVHIQRADGSRFRLNPRTGFISGGAQHGLKALFAAVPTRF